MFAYMSSQAIIAYTEMPMPKAAQQEHAATIMDSQRDCDAKTKPLLLIVHTQQAMLAVREAQRAPRPSHL